MKQRTIQIALFLTGLAGVVYEVLYFRLLTTAFGDAYWIHLSLLATFFLGLGVGARFAHRWSRHLPQIQIFAGIYAWVFPWALGTLTDLLYAPDQPLITTTALTVLSLLPPALAIGTALPVLTGWLSECSDDRPEAQYAAPFLAYALNNFAAVLALLGVEYFLIRWMGFHGALAAMGVINVGTGVWLLRAKRPETVQAEPVTKRDVKMGKTTTWAFLWACLGSGIFIAYLTKTAYLLLFPHRENFALCTAATLFLLTLGTLYAQGRRLSPFGLLTWACFSLMSVTFMLDAILWAFRALDNVLPSSLYLARSFVFLLILGIPYFFLGSMVPVFLSSTKKIDAQMGRLLAWSCVSNVLGFIVYAAWLHPKAHFFHAPIVILFCLSVALVLLFRAKAHQWTPTRILVLTFSFLVLPWVAKFDDAKLVLFYDPPPPGAKVTHYKSWTDNVAYVHGVRPSYIIYNGHPSIFVEGKNGTNKNEILAGVLPALMSKKQNHALVLGLGTGITAGAASEVFSQTDVVEINAAFIEMSKDIPHLNFEVMEKKNVHIHHNDARIFLQGTAKRYDAIISTVASPAFFAAGKIYTQEFLELAKAKLNPGGTYHTWIAPVEMSNQGMTSLVNTLGSVFKHCNLAVLRRRYYFLSCRDTPLPVLTPSDVQYPKMMEHALRRVNALSVREYLSSIFVSDDIFLNQPDFPVPLNTDVRPYVEFSVTDASKIMRGDPKVTLDLLVAYPDRFNVRGLENQTPKDILSGAITMSQLHLDFFRRIYAPYLKAHPDLLRLFLQKVTKPLFRGPVDEIDRRVIHQTPS